MQIETTISSHRSELPPSKNLQIIDAGDGVQKREHCYTGVGIEIGTTAMENSLKFP